MALNKLTAEQNKKRAVLAAQIDVAYRTLEAATTTFAAKEAAIYDELNTAIEAFNDVAGEVKTWMQEIHDAQQETFDDRSEKWQEGEAGQNYQSWMDEWEAGDQIEELAYLEAPDFENDFLTTAEEVLGYLDNAPDAP